MLTYLIIHLYFDHLIFFIETIIIGLRQCWYCELPEHYIVVYLLVNSVRYWLAELEWIGESVNVAMKSIVDVCCISSMLFDRYCSWWRAEAWNIVRTLRTSSLMRVTFLHRSLHFVSEFFFLLYWFIRNDSSQIAAPILLPLFPWLKWYSFITLICYKLFMAESVNSCSRALINRLNLSSYAVAWT